MEFKRIRGATREMAKDQPEYSTLAIRDIAVEYDFKDGNGPRFVPMMLFCMEPTPDELEALNRGELIYFSILGRAFPPIQAYVGDPHPDTAGDAE